MNIRKIAALALASLLMRPTLTITAAQPLAQPKSNSSLDRPIKHLVVIFSENISFDHYFGTYPYALNPPGEPAFHALPGTPTVNGLMAELTDNGPIGPLLTNNPNFLNTAGNGANAANPFRLTRAQAWTASQGHSYMPEQLAFDKGLMDLFPNKVGAADSAVMAPSGGPTATKALNMGYYDGNTVTAMWNYAQHFAMNDNSYNSQFGPSTPGALNLISGQTNGLTTNINPGSNVTEGSVGGNGTVAATQTVVGDAEPLDDTCRSTAKNQVEMLGLNVGDLMNTAGISWGWFEGGFDLTARNPNGSTGCSRSSVSPIISAVSPASATITDYVPHHQPFMYYASTSNPLHTRPTSVNDIGHQGDAGNHQYDLDDFYAAINAGNFPTVSFLKAAAFQDGHPGNSTPLDEQAFFVHVINFLQQQPEWCDTVVIIAYDDSDGWYDHQMSPIVNQSKSPADGLTGTGLCGDGTNTALAGPSGLQHAQGRCGYGPRTPLLVISPWAKANFVDHTLTDQSSILRFIEDNFLNGQRIGGGSFDAIAGSIENMFDFDQSRKCTPADKFILDEQTGLIASQPPPGHQK
jgi:phospholipase C